MGFFQKIKNWLSGGGKQAQKKTVVKAPKKQKDGASYEISPRGNVGTSVAYRRAAAKKKEEEKQKKEKVTQAFKAKPETDEKVKIIQQRRVERALDKGKRETMAAPLKAQLDKKYDTSTKEGRQRIKSGGKADDPMQTKYEVLKHPIANSVARGQLNVWTLGASEVLANKATRGEARKAEEFYQRNKNRYAELASEFAGTVLQFGMTGGASASGVKSLAKTLAPRAFEEGTEKAVAKIASSKLIQKAAEKEALKKFGVDGITDAAINNIARRRAWTVISEVGKDAAINMTTGGVMDVNQAIADSENWQEFLKNFGINAGTNIVLGGVSSVAPGVARDLGVDEAARKTMVKAGEYADDAARKLADTRGAVNLGDDVEKGLKDLADEADIDDSLSALADDVEREEVKAVSAEAPEAKAKTGLKAKNALTDKGKRMQGIETTAKTEDIKPLGKEKSKVNAEPTAKPKAKPSSRAEEIDNELAEIKNKVNDPNTKASEKESLNAQSKKLLKEKKDLEAPKGKTKYRTIDATDGKGGKSYVVEYKDGNRKKRVEVIAKSETKARSAVEDEIGYGSSPKVVGKVADTTKVKPPKAEVKPKPEVKNAEDTFPVEGTPEAEELVKAQEKTRPEKASEAKAKKAQKAAEAKDAKEKLREKVKEKVDEKPIAEEDKPLRVNEASKSEELGTPKGVIKSREVYANNNEGEVIEGGRKTTVREKWLATKEYHENHATGQRKRNSKTSITQLHAMDSDAEREIREQMRKNGDLDYRTVKTDELLDKVSKELRDDPQRYINEMIDINDGGALDFRTTPEWQARVHYIMSTVDPSADDVSEIAYTEAYKLATAMSSKAGQTNNLRRQFVHLTKEAKRDTIMDELANVLYNSQGFRNAHSKELAGKGYYDQISYVKSLLYDDPEIEEAVNKLVKAGEKEKKLFKDLDLDEMAKVTDELPTEDADDIVQAHAELLLKLNEKNPKTAFDVLQEMRYLNMLANPKTHIRNIGGSAFFAPIRQLSNAIRSGIEGRYANKAGVEITKHGGLSLTAAKEAWAKNPTTEAGKEAKKAFESLKDEILGSVKWDNANTYKGRAKTIPGKVLDAASDFNSKLLSGEDDWFRTKAFKENYIKSYNKYLKDGVPITDKLKRQIEQEAILESQIATFNEYNDFANYLTKLTKQANNPNASTGQKWAGRMLNAAMPFTKVPANIMKQSLNYSPIGLVKGRAHIADAIKKGDAEALNKAVDELASGLTGSAIFGLGMLFGGTSDAFTTNAGKEDYAAKFKKKQGAQNYSVTFKDPKSGEKYSVTLDWLVPNASAFFSGVELSNELFKQGDFSITDFGGDWAQVTAKLIEPTMETSMLSGLYNILESARNGYGDDDKMNVATVMLRELAQTYLNSLIPTALGQASRTAYKSDKQVLGEDDWEYFRNQIKSKTGLGGSAGAKLGLEPLGADTTAYGDVKGEKNSVGDYAKSALKNFISPANIQKVDLSELDEQKIDQYEKAVKDGVDPKDAAYVFPQKQSKKEFSVGDEDIKMSNKDVSTYNQAKTKGGAEAMRYILEGYMFNRQTVDANGDKTPSDEALTKDEKNKLIKWADGKSIREIEKWFYDSDYYKKASPAEREKAVKRLWDLSNGSGEAVAAKRVGEQAVYKAQGKDVNEYNFKNEITAKRQEKLLPLIEDKVITYEEAVDFDRNAGKTYYYEDDEGGHSATYYNKKQMMEYLMKKGYSYEKAEALFNAYTTGKPYDGTMGGRGGRRRRGYRRYGRRGGGGSKVAPPKLRTDSAFKAKKLKTKSKSTKVKSKSQLAEALADIQKTEAKVKPPTPKGAKK